MYTNYEIITIGIITQNYRMFNTHGTRRCFGNPDVFASNLFALVISIAPQIGSNN